MDVKNNVPARENSAGRVKNPALTAAAFSAAGLLTVLISGVIKEKFAGSETFVLSSVPFALALLFSAAAFLDGLFSEAAENEKMEKLLLAGRKDASLLDDAEDVRFGAEAALAKYRRYAPYVFSLLGAAVLFAMLYAFNAASAERAGKVLLPDNAMHASLLSLILMLGSVFTGAFFIGQSRTAAFRLLRPAGSWMMLAALLCGMTAAVDIGYYNSRNFDAVMRSAGNWILAVLGAEMLFNFAVEFYRPRTAGAVRPLYESRIMAVFTEPGGVVQNLAGALDYQFGFKLSRTGLYAFVEKSLFPLLAAFLVIFYLSTSIHEILPGEKGVRERFGRVTSGVLSGGIYFTLPYPFGNIRRVNCDAVRTLTVGAEHGSDAADGKTSEVVLWTKTHMTGENNFLVAADPGSGNIRAAMKSEAAADTDSGKLRQSAHPVAFVGLTMPVQYKVKDMMKFAYTAVNPEETLRNFAEQTVIEYLAGTSLAKVLGGERGGAEASLREKLQKMSDDSNLGIEIIAVTLLDIHPPVGDVARAYQDVIGAMEKKETMIMDARTYETKVTGEARANAESVVSGAESYRYRVKLVAAAEKEQFERRLSGYRQMPAMYELNSYLSLLEENAPKIRKYLLSSGLKDEVYELNFEEKERLDLIDADLSSLVEKKDN